MTQFTAVDTEDSTLTLSFNCEGRVGKTIYSVIDQLVFRTIPFSFYWEATEPDDSGEKHLRTAGDASRIWEFTTREKGVVDIESVREAASMGDTAVWNLIDQVEEQFVPWAWDQSVAA